MANIVDADYVPVRNKQTQQFTISENTHHLDNNGVVESNYSYDNCLTCQDRLIVESEVEGCEDCISVNAVIFVALNFIVDGMKSKSWWRSIWMMITFSQE